MKVCVIGLGYIGLPTAALLARAGDTVVGVDIDPKRVETVNRQGIPFNEPELPELIEAAYANGLTASLTPVAADVYLVCVPTPGRDRKADVSHVINALESLAPVLPEGALVVVESTVPPGFGMKYAKPILDKTGKSYGLVYCAERAIPGKTVYEMTHNDRVIGALNGDSFERAKALYSGFVVGDILRTDITTAEMVKLMENTYRDVNIALANEFAKIGEDLGINAWEAIQLANRHPRVGILSPGPGVGGHCIAVDPWFLVEVSHHADLIHMAREVNLSMPHYVTDIVTTMLRGIPNPVVSALGLAYKKDVGDTRESPSLQVVELLRARGVDVRMYDPHVTDPDLSPTLEASLDGSDCILLLTDHTNFKDVRPSDIKSLRTRNVVDTRNSIDREMWESAGFQVRLLGDGR